MAAGYADFILKSDQENAISDVKRAAVAHARSQGHGFTVKYEESPVAQSECNAHVERAIWGVQSKTRTLKAMSEDMHKVKLPTSHPLLIRAIHYASMLVNLFQVGSKDGKTAYERRKGKKYRRKLP